ncbi:hypothetical protein B0H21DRAFT_203465 [Amylocystis lapponica]|nr:hypothetical protein B0H21DRAFT_203465 [Amylocystis lapponica]
MSASPDQEQAHDTNFEPLTTQQALGDDPAASLRAAALLTLKSKRRKLGTVSEAATPVASRSTAIPTSIQLDYGQEEPSAGAPSPASSAPVAPVPESNDGDDGQAREEGEISDSETTASPSLLARTEPKPSDKALGKRPISPKSMPPPPSIAPAHVKMEPPTTPVLAEPAHIPMDIAPSFAMDADHVRPGLAMNQAQYDAAKDIVLDLLGWGVPPEYLVNCGLSREIVYYVFVEFNLRLPANLDTTGIPPYPPLVPAPVGNSRLTPPRKTPVPDSSTHTQTLSAAASTFVPSPGSPSLLDMEAQRRQELLARKAVLASRKLKQQVSMSAEDASSSTPSLTSVTSPILESKDVEMATEDDPTKTVDDFLKSIEPVGDREKAASFAPPRRTTFDDMDIDEPIPGLTATGDPTVSKLASPPTASSTRSTSSDIVSPTSAVPSSIDPDTPIGHFRPLSANSVATLNGAELEMDSPSFLTSTQSRGGSSGPGKAPPLSRRGTKRPVAADFVDMEPGSSRTHSSNGYYSNGYYNRRKLGAFAGVSSMRRCVIDVSDSEDEMEEGYIEESLEELRPSSVSRNGSLKGGSQSASTAMLSRARLSPSMPPANGKSPAALLEKEEEIRRMRELIHQREQNRLRKLIAISTTSTLSSDGTTSFPVKQEEDDTAVSIRLKDFDSNTTQSLHGSSDQPDNLSPLQTPSAPPSILLSSESASGSTSTSGTPIDIISNGLDHSMAGDKGTPPYEQQFSKMTLGPVGVFGSHDETSAQVQPEVGDIPMQERGQVEQAAHYAAYASPLDLYPLLRSHSQQFSVSSQSFFSSQQQSTSATSPLAIDLNALKWAAAKHMLTDPKRRICQYEVPGGGECRDPDCEDIHLSRISSVEPSDQEIAQYLYAALSIGSRHSVQDLKDALEDARRRFPTKNIDDRVSQALVSLGVR